MFEDESNSQQRCVGCHLAGEVAFMGREPDDEAEIFELEARPDVAPDE
jgi:hypothetical protein